MINIIEVIPVIQGEGKYMGVPHLLIRFSGCPLRCSFMDTACDTPYASINAEAGKYTMEYVLGCISSYSGRHIMITGGEPTAYWKSLSEILSRCKENEKIVTIETAGYKWDPVLIHNNGRHDYDNGGIFISLSPKMSNSVPIDSKDAIIHNRNRSRFNDMAYMLGSVIDYQIKFVISDQEDIYEALGLVHKLSDIAMMEIPISKIWFMPEGIEQSDLYKRRPWLMEQCIEHNINYSDRLHIIAYGNKRGV